MHVVTDFPYPVECRDPVWIPMDDGIELCARLWLPEGAEEAPVPAILEYIPYRLRDGSARRDAMHHHYFAGHGYASLRVDIRGSGDSGGVLTDEYLEQELLDGEAILRWIDPVLPMMAFRSFAPSEAQAARDWAGALPAPAVTVGPGLRVIEDGTDGLLVFEIDGPMTKEDTGRVFEMFDRATEAHGKINLMVIVKDYEGFDLSLLGDRELMTSKFGAMGKVGRYAVVGAPGWMRSMVGVLDPLLPIKMRSFDAGEETAARDWASAG